MALDSDDLGKQCQDDDYPKGCRIGCLAFILACAAIDAATMFAIWQAAQFMAWIVSLMAYA